MSGLLLAGKAEVLLGVLLVTRHRSVRLVAALAVLVFIVSAAAGASGREASILVVAGSLAAAGGSRILAPGPALFAVRRAAGPWWLGPLGRLAGLMLIVGGVTGAGAVILIAPQEGWTAALRVEIAACLAGAALSGATAAAAPLLGATGAGSLAMLAAWLGGITPSGMAALLAPWPLLAGPAVLCWNALPLPWRAVRWQAEGVGADALFLVGWVGVGVLGAAWAVTAANRGDGRRQGDT